MRIPASPLKEIFDQTEGAGFVQLDDGELADDWTNQSRTCVWFGEFVHQLYEVRDVAGAFARFVGGNYVQHNPVLPDGAAAAVAMLTDKFADPELRLTRAPNTGGTATSPWC